MNVVFPILDFSTIKNELFPVIASVFTKTSSLGIKVRGLEAFVVLCGGSNDPASSNDGLDGIGATKKNTSTPLDKYTMQEKIVPLIRAIKTKEPAVAMAALNVLRQIGTIADADFVAMDILPILWNMSLGPLLNLQQFQAFMELIKSLSVRVETEQTKKLQELSGTNGVRANGTDDFMSFGAASAFPSAAGSDDPEMDFERLVKGGTGTPASINPLDSNWEANVPNPRVQQAQASAQPKPPSFAWSTPSPTTPSYPPNSINNVLRPQQNTTSRTVTPDLSNFGALTPSATQFSQPLQPQSNYSNSVQPQSSFSQPQFAHPPPKDTTSSINWNTTASVTTSTSNPWASTTTNSSFSPISPPPLNSPLSSMNSSMPSISMNQINNMNPMKQARPALNASQSASSFSSFSLPPPPGANGQRGVSNYSAFGGASGQGMGGMSGMGIGMGGQKPVLQPQQQQQQKKSGLDAYESLL